MSDDEKRKLEPPLHLDMPFDEALARYAQTDPEEVEPPKGKKPKVPKAAKRLAEVARAKHAPRKQIG
jgi:hypothetical protein